MNLDTNKMNQAIPLAVAAMGCFGIVMGGFLTLLTAVVGRKKVVVHRHEHQEAPQRSSGSGGMGVVLFVIGLLIAGIVTVPELQKVKDAKTLLQNLDGALQKYQKERGEYP